MSPEKQRIAIAEVCGWGPVRSHWEKDGESAFLDYSLQRKQLPDYLNDLNAMHEAENLVILKEHPSIVADYKHRLSILSGYKNWNATAAQRAEAFLKTIGKWTDE